MIIKCKEKVSKMPALKIKNLPVPIRKEDTRPKRLPRQKGPAPLVPGTSQQDKINRDYSYKNPVEYDVDDVKNRKVRSIKQTLNMLHSEPAPEIILQTFKKYWPQIKTMTMKEAWLRVIYLEALSGQPWASNFIAYRTEGSVDNHADTDNKGAILAAIDEELKKPVYEDHI